MEPTKTTQPGVFHTPDDYQRAMLEVWRRFVANQQLDTLVPPVIAASWRRSWKRVNPNNTLEIPKLLKQVG